MDTIDTSLVDWSRAQFALTAMYHWIFVPLTLGLGVVMAIMETLYVRTGREFWKQTTRFWMKLFGINFAMGVATGLILEFEFGTNWSNYSWFVGDIFGSPLAIEGIVAFFLESTFIGIMYFGWDKVSKGTHLVATWLTIIGATLSAWWILVANAWMQYPVGMAFNPDSVRNEMVDFAAVALSPVAVTKFCHTVASSWVLGAMFVVTMTLFRLPYALLVGVLIALLSLIPMVGAFVGCGAGVLLIALTDPWKALLFAVLFLVLQQIEGNLIYPHVVGNSVGLPSIWVLAAVTVGGGLMGVVGMLVFIPLCSVLYALFRDYVKNQLAEKRVPEDKWRNP